MNKEAKQERIPPELRLRGFFERQGSLSGHSAEPMRPHQQNLKASLHEQVQRSDDLLDEHWSSQCIMTACLLQGWASYADHFWCPDDCVAALMEGASTRAAALDKMQGKFMLPSHDFSMFVIDRPGTLVGFACLVIIDYWHEVCAAFGQQR